MKTIKKLRFMALLCLYPLMNGVYASSGVGMVDLIQGEVYATLAGEKRQLSRGSSIQEGDTIETIGEGSAVVVMANGIQWDIFDESKMSILQYQDGEIYQVDKGQITYTSAAGQVKERTASVSRNHEPIEIRMKDMSIYPIGTKIVFTTVNGVTVGLVVDGEARVVASGATTSTKVATEGMWFVKDAQGTITLMKNEGQALQILKAVGVSAPVAAATLNSVKSDKAVTSSSNITIIENEESELELGSGDIGVDVVSVEEAIETANSTIVVADTTPVDTTTPDTGIDDTTTPDTGTDDTTTPDTGTDDSFVVIPVPIIIPDNFVPDTTPDTASPN